MQPGENSATMGYLMPATVEVTRGVAVIRVRQPLSPARVRAALPELPDVAALVLHGGERPPPPDAAAPEFKGADFKGMARVAPAERRAHLRELDALRDELAALPVPVVAAIDGSAVGDVAELAMACDHRVLAEGGDLVSMTGGRVLMVRRVTAAEALRTGMVDQVVARGAVLSAAVELASRCRAARVGRVRRGARSRP
ncbi:enoyl-CoA hydratase/isomerase family protein [Saccharothrix australiensis]|uniref:Enoyl-CoA hydratase/isomerase-like protein n=1 Tax=Saccharothrix australiensis TaxID=2072 RepID=A0A495W768_9PSEU|nr:enoyl-CoA hydratase/isomerase family protein [Saccharothrix australiensis]RKT56483.1 enoyl-CoA hydratase/isomerase-like protein [Saccharothrix australiensis]